MSARINFRLALVSSSAVALMFASQTAVQAHNWSPADGAYGYTNYNDTHNPDACDGPNSEPDWPLNDGRVCFNTFYYDHTIDSSPHLHIDHIKGWFKSNNLGNSDYVTKITNIHVQVFPGNCDNAPKGSQSWPACDPYVDNAIFDEYVPNMTVAAQDYLTDIGLRTRNATEWTGATRSWSWTTWRGVTPTPTRPASTRPGATCLGVGRKRVTCKSGARRRPRFPDSQAGAGAVSAAPRSKPDDVPQ